MAWIESHQEIWRHPKTKKLARLLGVSVPTAVGHLHGIWYWALDFAQDGDLRQYDPEEIADAALWEGDPRQFVEALVTAGYLDQTDDGLSLHDWYDYAGRLMEQREARREQDRARKQRQRERQKAEARDGHTEVTEASRVTGDEVTPLPHIPVACCRHKIVRVSWYVHHNAEYKATIPSDFLLEIRRDLSVCTSDTVS